MPVTHVTHDLDALTLTLVADFAAPVERIWEVYADPRKLERIWGPPQCPATFVDHDMTPGGRMNYYMTLPDGTRHHGYWEIVAVDAPHTFTYDDGFALDDTFAKNPDMPVNRTVNTFEAYEGGTRATYVGTYASAEALQQVLSMGVVEGATAALNQIDDLIAA